MGIRQNEGYAITDSFHLGKEEFVLGVHLKAANQYVTWRCRNQTDYYWGHYFQDLFAAQKDFAARIQEKITQMEEEKSVQAKTFPPPSTSPWGEVQTCEPLLPGVYSVITANHGGIMALQELAKTIFRNEARACGFIDGSYLCFEEDCDAPVALQELIDKGLYTAPVNQFFGPGEFEKVISQSLQTYHPEYWQVREKMQAEQKQKQSLQNKNRGRER